jgi:hypothetical protein
MEIDTKIDLIKDLISFVQSKDTCQNQDDIRSVTTYSFYQISESFLISLVLSKHISDIEYCKENINPNIKSSDISTLEYAFDGFIKDSFFIKLFVSVENHIRQIAEFYESSNNKINVISISATFKNLTNINKTTLFSSITIEEKNLFEFYCYLRNTIHNFGFQTKANQQLKINDSDSIIDKNEVLIDLTLNSVNNLTFKKQILIQEQIFKLILKMDNLISENDFIKHRLVAVGFNS